MKNENIFMLSLVMIGAIAMAASGLIVLFSGHYILFGFIEIIAISMIYDVLTIAKTLHTKKI